MNLPSYISFACTSACALVLTACSEAPPEAEAAAPPPQAAPQLTNPAPALLARRELNLDARPLALVAHDFDGDGFDDLAIATEKPGRLTVLAGSSEGLVEGGASLAIGDFPTNLALADGRLFVGSKASAELLSIEVVRAEGQLVPRVVWRQTPGGIPSAIAAADVDGRGEVEVLWATRDDRVLVVKEDAVHGSLQLELGARPVGVLASRSGPSFAVLCQGTNDVRVFDVSAEGNAALRTRIAMDGVPRAGAEADLDGDGDLETVFIGGDDEVLIFGLGGAGRFAAGEPLRTTQPGLVPAALSSGDLDGDGRDELVSLGLIDQGYSVLGDFGPGGAGVRISEYAGQDPWDLALGDFDGDGRLDLATACRGAHAISVLVGTGIVRASKPAFYQATRIGVGGNPLSIAAADLLGPDAGAPDGKPELATLDAADGMLSVLFNDGFGGLRLGVRLPVGASPRGLVALDVGAGTKVLCALAVPAGGAGRLVAFGRKGTTIGPLEVRLDEPRALPRALPPALPPAREAQIARGDLDGDGLDDLVLANPARPELLLLLGQGIEAGALRFSAPTPLALPEVARAVVLLRRPAGTQLAVALEHEVLILDREGRTLERLPAPERARAGRGCGRLAAADLDGDGFDDLAALWLGPQGTSPGLVATTTLGPRARRAFELPCGLAPADLGAADLNGDGLAEIFVAAQNSHLVNLWVNRGPGGLEQRPSIGVGLGPLDLAVADLLGKGRPDLIVANAFSADVSIVYNRPPPAE